MEYAATPTNPPSSITAAYPFAKHSTVQLCHFHRQPNQFSLHLGDFVSDVEIGCLHRPTPFVRIFTIFLVEDNGVEPMTSCMPCKRSPN
jgi:hypothetical protein